MKKRFLSILAILFALIAQGQDKTSSPYSYYGIGSPVFNGSAENRSMEGLSVHSDSIHYNFQNPAGLGALKLTTFTVGATQKFNTFKTNQTDEDVRNTSFDYIALGIPAGKLNFGFGIVPFSSVGYKIQESTENSLSKFEGQGGLNKLFLSFGYRFTKNFRIGVEGSYHFGNIKNKTILFQDQIQYGTREKNRSNLSGFRVTVGAQYQTDISDKLQLKTSASYTPKTQLNSENKRQLASVALTSTDAVAVVNEREINLADTKFDMAQDIRIGAGVGQFQKWFAGFEYENIGKTDYTNTSFSGDNIAFKKANVYRLGGFYIPKHNDITNYFNRIQFRAGLRYQETGLNINTKDIDEYGISFGVGLPAGQFLSNINLGVEYGQRGTTAQDLVKEKFINVFIGISFNDKWFRKRKYH